MKSAGPLNVCVVTAARSEYGLMRWVISDLVSDPRFRMQLVVTGSHLSTRHGHTVDAIRADGHAIACEVPVELGDSTPADMAAASAAILRGVSAYLLQQRPDCVLVLGDRWEMVSVALACMLTGTPLGHFSGGEVTEGAMDDSIRHALTKFAHLHFVANETYGARVQQLGEQAWRINICGGPGLDNFTRLTLLDREALGRDLGLDLGRPTAVVTLHPPTQSPQSVDRLIEATAAAMARGRERFGLQYVITGPCADPGADRIDAAWRRFVDGGADLYVASLGQVRYLSLLKVAQLMIGNSSSAFHEAPVARLPAVNIGDRQDGRLRSENILDAAPTADAVFDGISRALNFDRERAIHCAYGDGAASVVALQFLADVFATRDAEEILRKRFVDLPVFAGPGAASVA